MKKKLLAGIVSLTLLASIAFAGCGSQKAESGGATEANTTTSETTASADSSKAEKKVLKLAHYYDPSNKEDIYGVAFEKLVTKFEEQTGIEVQNEVVPWSELESKLVITNQSGSPAADLFWLSSQKLASLINAKALLPLDDLYTELNASDFSKAALDGATYPGDNKKYLVLASIHGRGIWYNTDYVKEAPKTWDEMIKAAVAVNNPSKGFYGLAFWLSKAYGSTEVVLAPMLWSAGGKLSNPDGSAAWANEGSKEALQFVSDAFNKHKVVPESCLTSEYDEVAQTFAAGNVAMIIDGTYRIGPFLQASELGKAGKFKFAPVPGKSGASPHFSNGWSMGIPSNSKNVDVAKEFIKFFSTKEIQIEHALFEGGLPVLNSCYEDPAFKEWPFPEFIANINANGRSMDPFVFYQEGLEAFTITAMSYVMDPSQDLDKLLKDSQDEFNKKYYNK